MGYTQLDTKSPPVGFQVVRWLFVLLLLACLGWGAKSAMLRGLASLDTLSVQKHIEQWQRHPADVTIIQWQTNMAMIDSAIARTPADPNAWYLKGKLLEWKALTLKENTSEAIKNAEQAYITSAHLRPVWADIWASAARMRWLQGRIDETFFSYLRKAEQHGRFRPVVMTGLAELVLASWQQWPAQYRPDGLRYLGRAMDAGSLRRSIIGLANQYHHPMVGCLVARLRFTDKPRLAARFCAPKKQ